MPNEERLMAEIRDANLSYLILAQRLIRADRAQALYRLGISDDVAAIIEALTPTQMIKVASGNTLMCRFRFDEEMIWSLLADHGHGRRRRRRGQRVAASRQHPDGRQVLGGRLTWPPAAFSKTPGSCSVRSN